MCLEMAVLSAFGLWSLSLCSFNCLRSFPFWCRGQDAKLYRFLIIAFSSVLNDTSGIQIVVSAHSEDKETLPEYLKPAWGNAQKNLTSEQTAQVKALLLKHKEVLAKSKTDCGRTDAVRHKINTGAAAPVKQNLRRLLLSKRELVREEISKMLKQGIIEP